jgi:hypothetical protein
MSNTMTTKSWWNRRYPRCVNCGTSDRDRRDRGFCERCFPFADRLRKVKTWDPNDVRTWKGSGYERYHDLFTSGQTTIVPGPLYVQTLTEMLEQELCSRARTGRVARGEEAVDGLDLEYRLMILAQLLHLRHPKSRFHGFATTFDHVLSVEGARLVYEVLSELLETRPMGSIYRRAFNRAMAKQKRARERTLTDEEIDHRN